MLPAQARAVPPANRVMRQSHGIRNLPEASAGLLGECRRRWTVWSPQGFSVHTCEHACCETLAKTHRMKSKSFTLRAAGHRPHPARDLHLRAHTAVLSVPWRVATAAHRECCSPSPPPQPPSKFAWTMGPRPTVRRPERGQAPCPHAWACPCISSWRGRKPCLLGPSGHPCRVAPCTSTAQGQSWQHRRRLQSTLYLPER
jgi:hypothetical protein